MQVLKVGSTYISKATGGVVTITPRGLIHKASEAYSGKLAEMNIEAKVFDAPKRGRGRPKGSKNKQAYGTKGK